MELLILIALFWLALWRGRRWYVQQPPVTVNVVVDGRSVVADADAAHLRKLLTEVQQ
jgi:hypothetical protein